MTTISNYSINNLAANATEIERLVNKYAGHCYHRIIQNFYKTKK